MGDDSKKVMTFTRAMTKKIKRKIGCHHQLQPRVTPTLVTPLSPLAIGA